jgi:hypothetical protein
LAVVDEKEACESGDPDCDEQAKEGDDFGDEIDDVEQTEIL